MYYINSTPNTTGNHGSPMGQPFPGSATLPSDLLQPYLDAKGFVNLTTDGDTVTAVESNQEALDAYLAEHPEPNMLEANKQARIKQSKTDLATYLADRPLQWTDGEYYSITAEKQAQLTGKIMAATMAQTMSQPYTLTWNSTGQVCKEWELSELSALAFAIDARVTALVSYQQTQEVAMREAKTQEELDAIVVDYDSVGATNEATE